MKTVGHGHHVGLLRGKVVLAGSRLGRLLIWLSALIHIPFDPRTLVSTAINSQYSSKWLSNSINLRATHHASSGIHGIVDRIRLDVAAAAHEVDLDHYKLVDVVKIFTNAFFRKSRIATADDKVPRGATADLSGYMAGQNQVAIMPPYVDLIAVSVTSHKCQAR